MYTYEIRGIKGNFFIARIESDGNVALLRASGVFNEDSQSNPRIYKTRYNAEKFLAKHNLGGQ